jgi:heme-degrading monooxygenase HmoA
MFERYTESARCVLFFARYEADQAGSLTIEPEHVLLGVLRDAPQAIARFISSGSIEPLRRAVADAPPPQEKVSTSVEIPFSTDGKLALSRAAIEADELRNRFIAPEHLVLGVLATSGPAVRALGDAGVDPDAMREFLRTAPEEEYAPTDGRPHPVRAFMSVHAVPGGARSQVVLRQWRGVVKPGLGDQYIRHLHSATLPSLSRLTGFIDATIFRREVEDGTEFQVTTVWRSVDDIKGFAGDDVTNAVVPPAAAALMVRYDDRAAHYEIVS